jgi:hypothetical protein
MNSWKQMTAINPTFALPTCGHASFATTGAFGTDAGFGGSAAVVRERVATQQDMGLDIAYVPGTSAWSPPTS